MKHGNQTKIANLFECTPNLINQIVKGKRGISWEMAKKFSKYFGKSSFFWMENASSADVANLDLSDIKNN